MLSKIIKPLKQIARQKRHTESQYQIYRFALCEIFNHCQNTTRELQIVFIPIDSLFETLLKIIIGVIAEHFARL